MPRIRPYIPTTEQQVAINKWEAVSAIAQKAGFDADAFSNTEFCLMPFFEAIVDECANIARLQARNFSGDGNESLGCHVAADAISMYKTTIGNYPQSTSVIK